MPKARIRLDNFPVKKALKNVNASIMVRVPELPPNFRVRVRLNELFQNVCTPKLG